MVFRTERENENRKQNNSKQISGGVDGSTGCSVRIWKRSGICIGS